MKLILINKVIFYHTIQSNELNLLSQGCFFCINVQAISENFCYKVRKKNSIKEKLIEFALSCN